MPTDPDDLSDHDLLDLLADVTETVPELWRTDGDGDPYCPEDDGPGWAYWRSGRVLRWCHGVLTIECDVLEDDLRLTARALQGAADGWSRAYDEVIDER